jgi:ankyrin repeat protein
MATFVKNALRSAILASQPLSPGELAVTSGLPPPAILDFRIFEEYLEQCGSLLVLQDSEQIVPHTVYQKGSEHQLATQKISPDLFESPPYHTTNITSKNDPRKVTIHFIHQSAKDYMLGHTSDLFSPTRTLEHEDIALRCLRYINSFEIFVENSSEQYSVVSNVAQKLQRGLRYPLQYWLRHADQASERMALLKPTEYFILREGSRLFQAWINSFGPRFISGQKQLTDFHIQHFAACEGKLWLLSWVLENHGQTAIHEAVSKNGRTPLACAIKVGNTQVVRWLLERGVSPNITWCESEETRLRRLSYAFLASPYNFTELSKEGSSQSDEESTQPYREQETNKYHYTGLSVAAVEYPDVFELLLQFGADINFKSSTGHSSLFLGASSLNWGSSYLNIPNGHREIFDVCKRFLERGADPNNSPANRRSLLHLATLRSPETVALLLEHGVDPDIRDENGRSPLHWAAYHERLEALKILCDAGADLNLKDKGDHTAVYYAAFYGTPVVVKILLEHGADLGQFEEGARIHNSQHWRETVWKVTKLVSRVPQRLQRRRRTVGFDDYMMKTTDEDHEKRSSGGWKH